MSIIKILPEAAKHEIIRATVLAIGPGRKTPKGEVIAMGTKIGDEVIYTVYMWAGLLFRYKRSSKGQPFISHHEKQ